MKNGYLGLGLALLGVRLFKLIFLLFIVSITARRKTIDSVVTMPENIVEHILAI